jgi:hypothetical protein
MACLDGDGEGVRDKIEEALQAENLRLLVVKDQSVIADIAEVSDVDEHLAKNIAALEVGKSVVWGTVHTYIGDGEA